MGNSTYPANTTLAESTESGAAAHRSTRTGGTRARRPRTRSRLDPVTPTPGDPMPTGARA